MPHKKNDHHKDGGLHASHDQLVIQHPPQILLESLVEAYLSGIDHMIVGGNEVHVEHGEVVPRPVYRQTGQGSYTGNDDAVDLSLVVNYPLVEGVFEEGWVCLGDVQGRIE